MPGINAWPSVRCSLDMGDERPSLIQGHTRSLGIRLEIQYKQVTRIRPHNFEEKIRLINAVRADTPKW